jgi:hypothetical protein
MKQLLSIDTNAKTVKGQKQGYMTGILYLAPYNLSGYQVCPMAKNAGCIDGCLNTAGRGAFNSVQQARINKTKYFFENRQQFMLDLAASIEALIRKAKREGLYPTVRLNGTSDIRWENISFDYTFAHGKQREVTIFELFPELQFYDYTKTPNRKSVPDNYDLTFSYSGTNTFAREVEQAFDNGERVAVVFRNKADIPNHFAGLECINGDDSDLRFLEPKNKVVALYAKGKAKKDTSGFVVDMVAT